MRDIVGEGAQRPVEMGLLAALMAMAAHQLRAAIEARPFGEMALGGRRFAARAGRNRLGEQTPFDPGSHAFNHVAHHASCRGAGYRRHKPCRNAKRPPRGRPFHNSPILPACQPS